METVTVTEAKASLSRLLERVLAGEEVAIGRRGRPEVVLRAYRDEDAGPRRLGQYQGEYWMSPDFDEPDADLEVAFLGDDA